MQTVTGIIGVALAWGLAGAQWQRSRQSSAGISGLSWAIFLAVNLSWGGYAVGTGSAYLLANTAGAAALNTALLWQIRGLNMRTVAGVAACAGGCWALGVVAGWSWVAVACFALAFAVRGPQIAEAAKASDLSGVSLTSWWLAVVNNIIWTIIGAQRGDWWFAGANIGLTATTLALIAVVVINRASNRQSGV